MVPKRPVWERLLVVFGIRKMSSEEYLVKLKKQRDTALNRIRELEEEARIQADAVVAQKDVESEPEAGSSAKS